MNRIIFISGILFGVFAVILGAFGAHGLKEVLDTAAMNTFETGVKYHMYHALLLLVLANVKQLTEQSKKLPFYFIVIGIVFFSFSIYGLATNNLTAFNFKTIGFITPIGGVFLILGWLVLGLRGYKSFAQK